MRSWILVPAGNERALGSVARAGADAVIIDLSRPQRAPDLQRIRLQARDWLISHREQVTASRHFQRWARIPALAVEHWRDDLEAVMEGSPHGIYLSACTHAEDIRQLASVLYEIEDRLGLAANSTRIMAELGSTPASALQLLHLADDLHPRVSALTWDGVGLAHELGARRLRGPGGRWSDPLAYVRAQVLLIAHARGLEAIEHPFREARDPEVGKFVAEAARADGFTGMLALQPSQVAMINQAFAPTDSELAEARRIVSAFATDPPAGTVTVGERRITQAALVRARALVESA